MREALVILALSWVPAAGAAEPIVVGSKAFTESRVLAEVLAQLIEARTDLAVARRTNIGGTMLVHAALVAGEIDLYAEYTGTAWSIVLKREETPRDPLRTFLLVKSDYEKRFGVTWLAPFGFSNSYAVAMLESTAEELGVTRISDLAPYGGRLRAGWSHEFLNREDGFQGLAAAYGLAIADNRGMEHGLAYEAIRSGLVDLTDAYTTDGKLLRFPVRLLEEAEMFGYATAIR